MTTIFQSGLLHLDAGEERAFEVSTEHAGRALHARIMRGAWPMPGADVLAAELSWVGAHGVLATFHGGDLTDPLTKRPVTEHRLHVDALLCADEDGQHVYAQHLDGVRLVLRAAAPLDTAVEIFLE